VLWIGTHGGGPTASTAAAASSGIIAPTRAGGEPGYDIVRVVRDAGGGNLWIGTNAAALPLDPDGRFRPTAMTC
jgi:hypothetical protein